MMLIYLIYMVRSGEYTGASRNTATLPVEIACCPWAPVESMPTCSPMSLETIRVICSHTRTFRTPLITGLMAARRLCLRPVGDISEETRVGKCGAPKPQVAPKYDFWSSLFLNIANSPSLIHRQLEQQETSCGHQGSARGLGMSVADSNSLQGRPR